MKNLFWGFTPYHIRLSNYIAKELNNDENFIQIFEKSFLSSHVECEVYKDIKYFFLDKFCELSKKSFFENLKLAKECREETKRFEESVKKINPDRVFIFSDNPIYFQKVLSGIQSKVILVEEGTAMYNEYNFKKEYKKKLQFVIKKVFFYRYLAAKSLPYARCGFEDYLVLREPTLIDSRSEKIKLDDNFFKKVFIRNEIKSMDLEKGYLYCPAGTIYNKNKMLEITRIIFKKFYNEKIKLYVKLHPRERYSIEIKKIMNDYSEFVSIIENQAITSEDIIIQNRIKGIISDFSSMIINAPYIREELEVYTTLGMMEEEHNINLKINITIFDFLKKQGKIKDFRDFGRINSKGYL